MSQERRLRYTYTMEFYLAIIKSVIIELKNAVVHMKIILLNEKKQTEKNMYFLYAFYICTWFVIYLQLYAS